AVPGRVLAGGGAGPGVREAPAGGPGDLHRVLLPVRAGLGHGLCPVPRPALR
ncbi:hypothetical protein HGM15179_021242, partial [Zosterops borbonicus]